MSQLPSPLGGASAAPSTRAAAQAEAALRLAGFHAPPWTALAGSPPVRRAISATRQGDGNKQLVPAWISGPLRRSFLTLTERLGLCCSPRPTREEFTLQDDTFRCVLLRRLRLPLPLEARACRCGGALDELGDHRAACPTAGVLVRRACPLERAAARICREAGARVATNIFLHDLNLGLPLTNGRRLEVVAHGLPAFGGVQVAVDVTLVSPLRRDGSSRSRADHEPGLALRTAADGARRLRPSSTASRRAELSPAPRRSARRSQPRTGAGGGRCSQSRRRERSLRASANSPPTLATRTPARRWRAMSCPTPVGRRARRDRSRVSPCFTAA